MCKKDLEIVQNFQVVTYKTKKVYQEENYAFFLEGSKGGAVVRALASHQCGPGSNPGVDMWVEFVVGSLPCSERFFSGYSGFPLSPKPTLPNSNSIWNVRTLKNELLSSYVLRG